MIIGQILPAINRFLIIGIKYVAGIILVRLRMAEGIDDISNNPPESIIAGKKPNIAAATAERNWFLVRVEIINPIPREGNKNKLAVMKYIKYEPRNGTSKITMLKKVQKAADIMAKQ